MITKGLETLLIELGLRCKLCSQEKAILVDRHKPPIEVSTLGSDGKVRIGQYYPTYRHPLYCPYHAKEGVPSVGRES